MYKEYKVVQQAQEWRELLGALDAPDLDHPVSHILDFRGSVEVVLLVISSISFDLPFCLDLVVVVDAADVSVLSMLPAAVAPPIDATD